ncbi:MAG: ABC transporter substrate-binding protein [Rhodobacteraceae bacterium]|nr:ABC transporter substrate-binding protein [Paracoccaceae bacterium]
MTRRTAWWRAGVAAAIAAATASAAHAESIPLSISASLNIVFGPVFVLGDREIGIGERHGLDISVKMFPTGVASMEAALSGNLDLPIMNTAVALPVLVSDKACFRSGIIFTDFGNLKVVGDISLNSVADLVGKRVGTVERAIGNTALHFWLDLYQIPRDKVQIVNVQPQDMPAALARGDVDAIIWPDPVPSQIIAMMGPDKVHVIGNINEAYRDTVPLSVTCTWYEKYGDDGMQKLVAAWIEATDYVKQNPQKAAELTGAGLRQDPAVILKQWTEAGWLEGAWPADLSDSEMDMIMKNVEYLLSVGRIDKRPDLARWISSQWLKTVAPDRIHLSNYGL